MARLPPCVSPRRPRGSDAADRESHANACHPQAGSTHVLARHGRLHPRLERGGEPARPCSTSSRRAAGRGRPRRRRRLDRPHRRRSRGSTAPRCSRSARTAGCAAGIAAGYRVRARARVRLLRARRRGRTASGRRARAAARASPLRCVRRGGRLAVRLGRGLSRRTATSRAARDGSEPQCSGGRWALAPRPPVPRRDERHVRREREGAARRSREPYEAGAPEVEALLRLDDAGLRVEEVPVDMRERASGESKLRGSKAVMLVLTVTGLLLTYRVLRHRRAPHADASLVVLGYSDGSTRRPAPHLRARGSTMRPGISLPGDVVVLSGWARGGRQAIGGGADARRMAWRGPRGGGRPGRSHHRGQRPERRRRHRADAERPRSSWSRRRGTPRERGRPFAGCYAGAASACSRARPRDAPPAAPLASSSCGPSWSGSWRRPADDTDSMVDRRFGCPPGRGAGATDRPPSAAST